MRIVDGPTFLALPPGTVFSVYKPAYTSGLLIKGETTKYRNYWSADLTYPDTEQDDAGWIDLAQRMEQGEDSGPIHFAEDRSIAEESDLFMVYEREDVEALISALSAALAEEG
ncbi:MAG: hypothetical protein ABW043_16645 [Devosia sp.]|uniref:hypothetical protein n=1 Tax=Devosia sp. TaxID=1871048 RepID=UPI00339B311D